MRYQRSLPGVLIKGCEITMRGASDRARNRRRAAPMRFHYLPREICIDEYERRNEKRIKRTYREICWKWALWLLMVASDVSLARINMCEASARRRAA